MSDDGACCTRLVVYTESWSRAYAPPSPAYATVVVFEREDGIETDPVIVPDLELLGQLIAELTPPVVTIKSAKGEDVSALKALVELATAAQPLH